MSSCYEKESPDCGALTDYNELMPLICSGCDRQILPCNACMGEYGANNVNCNSCPWEGPS
ncbi:MAG: hypothetical protein KAH24_01125 [Holophagae bacterium]|nr:hypothetical protein [Holophagae bacterium]